MQRVDRGDERGKQVGRRRARYARAMSTYWPCAASGASMFERSSAVSASATRSTASPIVRTSCTPLLADDVAQESEQARTSRRRSAPKRRSYGRGSAKPAPRHSVGAELVDPGPGRGLASVKPSPSGRSVRIAATLRSRPARRPAPARGSTRRSRRAGTRAARDGGRVAGVAGRTSPAATRSSSARSRERSGCVDGVPGRVGCPHPSRAAAAAAGPPSSVSPAGSIVDHAGSSTGART